MCLFGKDTSPGCQCGNLAPDDAIEIQIPLTGWPARIKTAKAFLSKTFNNWLTGQKDDSSGRGSSE